MAEDAIQCKGITLSDCQVDENSVLETFEGLTPEYCQILCNMTYNDKCKFFLHDRESKTCQLLSEPYQNFINNCTIGGPPSPGIKACLESSNACKNYLPTGCNYTGDIQITLPDVARIDKCQETCREFHECVLFLFNPDTATCTLYQSVTSKNCSAVTMTPSPDINQCTKEQSLKLLLISGIKVDGGDITTVTKIAPYKKDSSCQPIPDYPFHMVMGTAQNIENQLIVSCGSDFNGRNTSCYSLDLTKSSETWKEYTQLSEWRMETTSVMLDKNNIWVPGGYNGTKTRTRYTTDIIDTITRSSRQGPDLPEAMYYHCAAKLNEQYVFIGASYEFGKHAYIVNVLKEPFEFKRLPDMKVDRNEGQCGFIRMKSGERAVIVAGGDSSDGAMTSEIYLIDKNQWIEGPKLPCDVRHASSVNTDPKTFIFTGGYDCTETNDPGSIFQLDLNTMEFVTLPGKLTVPRYYSAATWVIDDEHC